MTTKLTERKGTGVRVHGTVGNITPLPCSYSIDGGAEITPNNTMSPPSSQYEVLFFQSQGLTAGFHSLLITTLKSDPSGLFFLDFFAVTPLPIATTSSLPSCTSNHTTGEIIGGVIGGLALLTFSAAFIIFFSFRWKKNHSEAHRSDEVGPGLGTL